MKFKKNTYQLAYGGIVAAILMLMMIALRILPTADLFINFLMSLCICVAVLEIGKRKSFLLYLTVTLLSFLWPGAPLNLAFVIIGGIYPFAKIVTEQESMGRRYGRTAAFTIKFTSAFLLGGLYYLIVSRVFLPIPAVDHIMALPLAELWIFPLMIIVVIVFDFLLSQGIDFYFRRLAPHMKREFP